MKRALHLLSIAFFLLSGCTSSRLSHDEARRRIAAIGQSSLVPDAIEIRRIVSQSDTSAIAESTVTLAFQFKRATADAEWHIESVRLGDRDWISLDEILAAINEARRRTTVQTMQQLAEGIEKFRAANGSLPGAADIVALTDILYPRYMSVLVREDGWGHPIVYEAGANSGFRLISIGADARRGTTDDVLVENSRPAGP
jgi:hypothetical protein